MQYWFMNIFYFLDYAIAIWSDLKIQRPLLCQICILIKAERIIQGTLSCDVQTYKIEENQ